MYIIKKKKGSVDVIRKESIEEKEKGVWPKSIEALKD